MCCWRSNHARADHEDGGDEGAGGARPRSAAGIPIRRGERVYTYRADQSDEGRGFIPTGRTNPMRGE
eukprot:3037447-Pyramimonas_sp.AAC.1